jgi:hypothetical protein
LETALTHKPRTTVATASAEQPLSSGTRRSVAALQGYTRARIPDSEQLLRHTLRSPALDSLLVAHQALSWS